MCSNSTRSICAVPDCDKLVRGNGLCGMHYARLRRHGSLEKPTPSPEGRERRIAALKGKSLTPEHRAKISIANTGHSVSEEARRKIGDANKARPVSAETRAKLSVVAKGRKGYWAGKTLSVEHRRKVGAANKGKIRTEEFKKNVGIISAGRKWSLESRAKLSASATGRKRTPESIEKTRQANIGRPGFWTGKKRPNTTKKGAECPFFGKTPPHLGHGKRTEYKGIYFRSSYEARFAQCLDKHEILWQYEPKRFILEKCTYLPDFYLPESNSFWEVKGWMSPQSKMRIDLFRKMFPETPLVLATLPVIKMMEASAR